MEIMQICQDHDHGQGPQTYGITDKHGVQEQCKQTPERRSRSRMQLQDAQCNVFQLVIKKKSWFSSGHNAPDLKYGPTGDMMTASVVSLLLCTPSAPSLPNM